MLSPAPAVQLASSGLGHVTCHGQLRVLAAVLLFACLIFAFSKRISDTSAQGQKSSEIKMSRAWTLGGAGSLAVIFLVADFRFSLGASQSPALQYA